MVLAVVATGCTSTKSAAPAASDTPAQVKSATPAATNTPAQVASATVDVAPNPTNDPAQAKPLAALAAKAAAASYDATYDFNTQSTKGLLRIFAAPPNYRVDVAVGPQTAQFYRIHLGTVSCGLRPDKPASCALVAAPGAPVPAVFDPGVQRLFADGLDALAKDPAGYAIAGLTDSSAAPGVPAGKCFHVERLADLKAVSPGVVPAPGKGFESGDYCFDPASGVLTAVRVATGTLTLTKAPTKPTDADFIPPAVAQPLAPDSGSASPSTSASS